MTDEDRAQLARIESKLDILIAALADEDDEPAPRDLDGNVAGAERDLGQSLG